MGAGRANKQIGQKDLEIQLVDEIPAEEEANDRCYGDKKGS